MCQQVFSHFVDAELKVMKVIDYHFLIQILSSCEAQSLTLVV